MNMYFMRNGCVENNIARILGFDKATIQLPETNKIKIVDIFIF